MDSRKSFEGIHEDYSFFLEHSSEPEECRSAMLERISELDRDCKIVQWLDFGCGGGEFLADLIHSWKGNRNALELSLLDVDTGYLVEAKNRLSKSVKRVICASKLEELNECYDLITSNHVMYYVPDAGNVVKEMQQKIKPGGQAMIILGGSENQLCKLWIEAFSLANQNLPYLVAEDIEAALINNGIFYKKSFIASELRFPDNRQNRLKILRFLLKEWLNSLGEESLLSLMDRHESRGEICMENTDLLLRFSSRA